MAQQIGRIGPLKRGICPRIGIDQHALRPKSGADRAQVSKPCRMDEQAVKGIAHADPPRLGIDNDVRPLLEICILVEIGIHDTGSGLYARHLGIVPDKIDEPAAPAWNQHIHIAHGSEKLPCGLMGRWEQVDGIRSHAFGDQNLTDQFRDSQIGILRITSALEHTDIAALEAKREHIEGHIRASLINDSDHPERDAHPLDFQAVRPGAAGKDTSKRRRKRGHIADVGCNRLQPPGSQKKTVSEWISLLHPLAVHPVG